MVGKAPSEGTKVTFGENAPVTREATGVVPQESLAAESLSSGGAFASNPAGTTTNTSEFDPASTRPHETPSSKYASGGSGVSSEQGQSAPSYVNTASEISASSGASKPHGTNVTQDDDMAGRPAKFNVEVGSKEDPSREALRTMQLKQTRGAPGTGEREVGERGKDEQPYAALGGETSA